MSIFRRFRSVIQQKANAAVDRIEDPQQALDLGYQQLLEEQQRIRRAIVEAGTARARLQAQASDLDARIAKLDSQAGLALQAGKEDLAREALRRQAALESQRTAVVPQLERVGQQVARLEDAARTYASRLEAFRSQSQTLKAQYAAAKAANRAQDAIAGVGEHSQDVALMLQRAHDKIAQTQARADAVEGLLATGALDDHLLGAGDDIEQRLALEAGDVRIQARLAELKERVRIEAPRAEVREVPRLAAPPAPAESEQTLVVRVHGEDQFRLPATARAQLDAFDAALVEAADRSDDPTYTATLTNLLEYIRRHGRPLDDDELVPSDVVVPGADTTLEEARAILSGGGSTPDAASTTR